MAKSPLSIDLVQMDIHWEQPARNRMKLDDLLSSHTPSDVIILPEMFSTGFTMNARAMAEPMDGETIGWMQETSSRLQCQVVGSLIVTEGERFFNRLIWMGPEGVIARYDKRHLFTMAGEDRVYQAGTERQVVTLKGWNISTMICYDLRFPVWCRSGPEVDVLLFVANFPDKRGHAWRQLLVARAIENQCYVVGVNRVGWDGKQHYYGGDSCVIDPWGNRALHLGGQETLNSFTLDGVELEKCRHTLPFLADADEFEIKL